MCNNFVRREIMPQGLFKDLPCVRGVLQCVMKAADRWVLWVDPLDEELLSRERTQEGNHVGKGTKSLRAAEQPVHDCKCQNNVSSWGRSGGEPLEGAVLSCSPTKGSQLLHSLSCCNRSWVCLHNRPPGGSMIHRKPCEVPRVPSDVDQSRIREMRMAQNGGPSDIEVCHVGADVCSASRELLVPLNHDALAGSLDLWDLGILICGKAGGDSLVHEAKRIKQAKKAGRIGHALSAVGRKCEPEDREQSSWHTCPATGTQGATQRGQKGVRIVIATG
mmetsp:Transcript_22062/g.71021  ORF Transcript_22062/g.71021 Transcript_22062/m.71021 type:complete len:276 (-) Transcript_22062:1184-2011(-)